MGIGEEVLVFLNVKGMPKLKDIDKAMTKLGYNLRLAGRDLMRMGGALQRTGQFFTGFASNVFRQSDIMGDAFEDIKYGWQDAFEQAGIIDALATAMEGIAEILEANPWIAWVAMAAFLFGQFLNLAGIFFKVIGFMDLLIGSVLSARAAGLGWGESIKFTIMALMRQNTAIKENIRLKAQEAAAKRQGISLSQLEAKATMQTTLDQKKQEKSQKKEAKSRKKMGRMFILGAAALAGMAIGFAVFGRVIEIVSPILEAIGDAFEQVFDALEASGVIDWIVEFIENNKELVVAMLVGIAALPLLISGLKTLGPVLGKLSGVLGGTGGVADGMTGAGDAASGATGGFSKTLITIAAILPSIVALVFAFSDFIKVVSESGYTLGDIAALLAVLVANTGALLLIIAGVTKLLESFNMTGYQTLAMVIALMAGAVSLIFAFGWFLQVASETGFSLGEITTIIASLTGAIVVFLAAIVVAVAVLAGLGIAAAAAMPVVALLLGIGAAAFLIGAGFLLAGIGIKLASDSLANLIQYVPQLMSLVPALFGIAAGFGVMGAAAFGAMSGIFGMAAAVAALGLAFGLLTIPLGIIRALGGEMAVVEAIKKIPGLAEGGVVTSPGLAFIHQKEMVVPAETRGLKGGGYTPKEPPLAISVDVTGASSVEEIVRKSVEASVSQISESLERKYRRSVY